MSNGVVARDTGGVGFIVVDSGKREGLFGRFCACPLTEQGAHPYDIGGFAGGLYYNIGTLPNLLASVWCI